MPESTLAPPLLDLGGEPVPGETADGVAAAAHYGDPAAELRAVTAGCGLVDRLWVEHLELRGEDRQRFLHGLVTCDVKSLAPGGGVYGLFTTAQGKLLAEARIEAHADRLLLELPAGLTAPVAEHLGRFVVADRVEITPLPELRALTLLGPEAPRLAAALAGGEPPAARWSHVTASWRDRDTSLFHDGRLGAPAVTVRLPAAEAGELARELVSSGARPAGFAAAECLRVEAGIGRFGADFGGERFPQEVGADEALDFEKGCYLGQEVVARIHYRGKVNHRLAGLVVDGEPPPAGSLVSQDGEECGRSGTAVRSSRLAAAVALAVLHRRAEDGARVEVDGTPARVAELPFAVG